MKKLIYLSVIFFLGSCSVKRAPTDIKFREYVNFNNDWLFCIDSLKEGIKGHWPENAFPDPVRISLPHTWNVKPGHENYYGWGWYRKEFRIPPAWNKKIVKLKFNAIYHDATIWLNGSKVFQHTGSGYTPFEVCINGNISFDSLNTLTILADNSFSEKAIPVSKSFDWPNDGGIIRDVLLIKSESLSMERVLLSPAFKADGDGTVNINIVLDTIIKPVPGRVDVWYTISFKNKEVSTGNRMMEVNHNEVDFKVNLENIRFWRFDHPELYDIKLAIGNDFTLTDNYTGTFGFRSLKTNGSHLIFNNESVRLPGLEWMPGSDSTRGLAEDTVTMFKMLDLLKNTGAVLTRFHWQQDEKILDWCDRNGMLVQEELPLWSRPFPEDLNDTIKNIADQQALEMILNHFNHPSIIAWGIGNELQAGNDEIISFLDDLRNKVLTLDTTRMVNYVSNSLQNSPGHDATTNGDIMMWNDYTGLWYALGPSPLNDKDDWSVLNHIHQQNPQKCLVISEYGLCEPFFKGGDPRRIRHMIYHTSIYDTLDYIGGLIYFCLNDYRTHMGEQVTGSIRERVHGITDTQGNKKPSYDTLVALFTPVRDLHIGINDNKLVITGINHKGIPSYSLLGYKVRLVAAPDNKTIEQLKLPEVLPGNKFNLVFDNPGKGEYLLMFISPELRVIRNYNFSLK